MSFLSDITKPAEELEAPQSFWYWSGLAAISATVKDNIYLDRGGVYKLYPNIYVMLHADSGLRKGPPVMLAKRLVKNVNNTTIISGRSSIQGILKQLGTAKSVPGGKVILKSTAFIAASEFSSSLVSDPFAMTILTDLYDRQYNEGDYKSLLKMESFELRDPTITMLVAINESHFADFIPTKDMKGGFIGRMFVVAETELTVLNSLIDPVTIKHDEPALIEYLKVLDKLRGPFKSLSGTRAGRIYDSWYRDFYTTIKKEKLKDPTGTVTRFGDSVLKVAMLISLSRAPDLIITVEDVEEALEKCEKLIGSIRKATMGKVGTATNLEQKYIVINELLNRDDLRASRRFLLKKYWMEFNAEELNVIVQSLEQAGMIYLDNEGADVLYCLVPKEAEELKRRQKGKIK